MTDPVLIKTGVVFVFTVLGFAAGMIIGAVGGWFALLYLVERARARDK